MGEIIALVIFYAVCGAVGLAIGAIGCVAVAAVFNFVADLIKKLGSHS